MVKKWFKKNDTSNNNKQFFSLDDIRNPSKQLKIVILHIACMNARITGKVDQSLINSWILIYSRLNLKIVTGNMRSNLNI